MKPETRKFLDKAQSDLTDAKKIAAIELANVAARSAYYAAFHAAEGFIFERTGKVAKTHTRGCARNSPAMPNSRRRSTRLSPPSLR
ncbi:MAG TPA: HEPN domain-containing protein [Roseiarcus sp.]